MGKSMNRSRASLVLASLCQLIAVQGLVAQESASPNDALADLQQTAIAAGASTAAHWGWEEGKYVSWSSHTNRLIPVYVLGGGLDAYRGAASPYRDADQLQRLYGQTPAKTLNPAADYFDQTNVFDLQRSRDPRRQAVRVPRDF